MSTVSSVVNESMECPLCLGQGQLMRSEILERLGMKDFARVAQLSAEEAFRLLGEKQMKDEQTVWTRFETELTKRISEIKQRHNNEVQALEKEKSGLELRLQGLENSQQALLQNARESERLETEKQLRAEMSTLDGRIKELEAATKLAEERKAVEIQRIRAELGEKVQSEESQKEDLSRRVEDYFGEIRKLREQNQELKTEMAKIARIGKREEMDFAEEARRWPGIWVSEKLPKHGDYIIAYRDASGAQLDPRMVVDNKDKESIVTEGDIDKLIRDANERSSSVAILVARDENQLRTVDKEARWARKDGIWILRTTRQWLPRDLDVLRPIFDRMRSEGPDFLRRNAALAEEIRRTFIDIDEVEKELKKAAKAIESASDLVLKYRGRLQGLCSSTSTHGEVEFSASAP